MNVSRDVITDLLPLYLAGEASTGTRALLEDYLRENPAFASTVREAAERGAALLESTMTSAPSSDHEKATLERVRRFTRRRMQLLALTFGFALTLLAFSFDGGHVRWIMLRDSPWQAVLILFAAFGCGLSYLSMGRRLRVQRER
jgi:ferric-dicitrate binding protein FerR (iron transport regulator)